MEKYGDAKKALPKSQLLGGREREAQAEQTEGFGKQGDSLAMGRLKDMHFSAQSWA